MASAVPPWPSEPATARLENALSASGVARDIKAYQGVGHSFMNEWETPSAFHIVERIAGVHHSTRQAEDAWRRIVVFFDAHLR